MKKIAGLVIILAVLILGGYYGMGILTESAIKKNIMVVNQTNGLVADVTQYHRGLFCSEAVIKWSVHIPEQVEKGTDGQMHAVPAKNFAFETPIKISHGPIIFANHSVRLGMGYAHTTVPMPEQYTKQMDEMFTSDSVKPQLNLDIFVSYLNRTAVEFALPAFNLKAKEGDGVISWKGLESKTSMTDDLEKISGTVVVEGLNVSKEGTDLVLDKVSSEYDLHRTATNLYLGDASFMLSAFNVTTKGQKVVSLSDLTFNTSSDIDDDLFSAHFSVGLKSFFVSEQQFGPGALEVSIRNLDAPTLAKIHAQSAAAQNGTEEQRQQALLAILPELPKLFSKGAELEISTLNFQLPQGTIQGELMVTLPKGLNSNPFELLQKLQGNAKLSMPQVLVKLMMQQQIMQQMAKAPELQKSLAEQLQANQSADSKPLTDAEIASMQADKQIAGMEQAGLFVADKYDYVIEVSLDQGKFVINGKAFDPAMLKF